MNNSYIASEIKNRVTMPQILRLYGFDVDRHNRIPCPLHGGTDRNCGVKDDYIHCFVCGESADQIKFVQKYFGLSFADAISKINADFALGLPIGEKIDRRKQMDIARQTFERNQKQKREREARERLETAFYDAHGDFARLDRQMREYAPKSGEKELHPLFVEAIKNIEYAKYALGCAEEELYLYEKRNS